MKSLMFKLAFFSFFVWLILSILKQWPDKYAHIIFCDVGQGDAILITYGNKQMLVDGGPDDKVLACLEENMPFWDRSIDYLVATHMDKDHIGGLPSVLERYSVDVIFSNLSSKETAGFDALEASFSREKKKQLTNKEFASKFSRTFVGQRISLGELITAVVISPKFEYETETTLSDADPFFEQKFKQKLDGFRDENSLSIGIYLSIGKVSVLLTGDMEKPDELAVIRSGLIDQVNILKAGHHGSKSSSARQFIEVLRPEISVISSGKNNQYNHPSPQVIDLFKQFKTKIYRTDSQGTIKITTDGVNYWRAI